MRPFHAFLLRLAIGFGLVALFAAHQQPPEMGREPAPTATAVSKDINNA